MISFFILFIFLSFSNDLLVCHPGVTVCTHSTTGILLLRLRVAGCRPAADNADAAVAGLIDVARDQSGKEYMIDPYATRFLPMPLILSHVWSKLQESLYILSYVSMSNDIISQ